LLSRPVQPGACPVTVPSWLQAAAPMASLAAAVARVGSHRALAAPRTASLRIRGTATQAGMEAVAGDFLSASAAAALGGMMGAMLTGVEALGGSAGHDTSRDSTQREQSSERPPRPRFVRPLPPFGG